MNAMPTDFISSGAEANALPQVTLSDELLARMDKSGPRYTSYPTADRFHDAFTEDDLRTALAQRGGGGGIGATGGTLSLYVHVPFCESVCYYCACNKIVTRDHDRADPYVAAVLHELDLVCRDLGTGQPVSQLHFGGGTPTFLSDEQLTRLMEGLHARMNFQERGEYSIEIDPRTVTRERLAHLRKLGFNRVSFGVQDFDEEVQVAVHRIQPFEQVQQLMRDARELGFESINADLIYGLPKQTPESFTRTVKQVASLRPDRIALYGYAHLPQRFKPQRRIITIELPGGGQRVGMLSQAIHGFMAEGYQYIGMDHFALPDDPLAQAKRQGRLHRNFQGYSTQPDCDLVALGVSAISRIGATYSQNAKTLDDYYDLLRKERLPVVRGITLQRDDLVRRAVIMSIMCHGRLNYESVSLAHLIDARAYFEPELKALQQHADDGLLVMDADGFELTPLGWFFVRSVAMVFDSYARTAQATFSRVL